MNPEQRAYVESELARGRSVADVATTLREHGYPEELVTEMLALYGAQSESVPVPSALVSSGGATVPGVWAIVSAATKEAFKRPVLIAFMVAVGLLTEAVIYATESMLAEQVGLSLVVVFGVLIVTMIVSFSVLRGFLIGPSESFGTSTAWTARHILPLLWVVTLSSLVIVTASIAFIIPAFIVAGYLGCVQAVRIVEGVGGIAALVRSTQLVSGYWWRMMLPFVVIGLIFGISVSVISGILATLPLPALAVTLLTSLWSSVFAVVMMAAVAVLYTALVALKGVEPPRPSKLRVLYGVMAALGPFALVAWVVLAGAVLFATMVAM